MDQSGRQFESDIALRRELGRGGLGMQQRQLDLQSELGRGELGLKGELGRGQLGVQRGQLGLQREQFGEGRRQFDVGQGFREEMGRGQLGLQREQFGEGRRQFDVGQGFREEMGRGDLGLRQELGRGQLGLGRDELGLRQELGRGDLGLRQELGRGELGIKGEDLSLRQLEQEQANDLRFQQLGLGREELALRGQTARDADARQAERLGISREQLEIQKRAARDKRIGATLGGLGGIASGVADFLPAGGIAKKILGIFSDEALKEELTPVHGDKLLKMLEAVPIQTWKYKGDTETHVGPTAQDFTKFGYDTGDRPRTIDMADYLGVTLGAVKALDAKMGTPKEHQWFEVTDGIS
jgi:hypothetical protein